MRSIVRSIGVRNLRLNSEQVRKNAPNVSGPSTWQPCSMSGCRTPAGRTSQTSAHSCVNRRRAGWTSRACGATNDEATSDTEGLSRRPVPAWSRHATPAVLCFSRMGDGPGGGLGIVGSRSVHARQGRRRRRRPGRRDTHPTRPIPVDRHTTWPNGCGPPTG